MKIMGVITSILFLIMFFTGGVSFFTMNPFATVGCILSMLGIVACLYLMQFVQD